VLDDDQGIEAPQEHGVRVGEVDGEDAAICQTVEAAIGWPGLPEWSIVAFRARRPGRDS